MTDTDRQSRDHPVLCSHCMKRTTFAWSGVCYVCVPLPMPTWHEDGAA